MRSVAIYEFGGPEVMQVAELPDPTPGAQEVRIKVRAATVNPTDISFRSGRNAAQLAEHPAPYVPGMEAAGVIDAVGAGSRWSVGQQVMAIVQPGRVGRGAQSELIVVPDASVAPMPKGASFEEAATIPMNGLTVRRGLDLLDLPEGSTLVVTGAAGAVGGYAVELAKVEGLRVIAIAGADDEELVRGFGADEFVVRAPDAIMTARALAGPEGADACFDAAVLGDAALPAVRDGGQMAVVRAYEGQSERSITVTHVRVGDYALNQEALQRLGELAEEGRLTMRVAQTYPPEQAGLAQSRLSAGGVRGRMLIVF